MAYWELPFQRPAETFLMNWERVRKYQGVELTARKRFSNRWMMMGSFTWNDTRLFYEGADRGYQDATVQEVLAPRVINLQARFVF